MASTTLFDIVAANLNRVSPEMAEFRKTRGEDGPLHQDDEFVVRMPGPWDGPVRVERQGRRVVPPGDPGRSPRGGHDQVPGLT
jgi:hypothetical protein